MENVLNEVKFISYDGHYPNLCRGTLVLEIKGERVNFEHIMCSGGSVGGADWDEVYYGPWLVNLERYPEYEKYAELIAVVINENVPFGCCGGCA